MCIKYENVLGKERWAEYIKLLDAAVGHLVEAQKVALELRAVVNAGLLGK